MSLPRIELWPSIPSPTGLCGLLLTVLAYVLTMYLIGNSSWLYMSKYVALSRSPVKLLVDLASAVILDSVSRWIHDHSLVSGGSESNSFHVLM